MIGIAFTTCGLIFTLLLILFLYLRLFSIRKILIFALTFYAGFFLTFCKINNSDCLVPMAPVEAVFTGRIVSIPDSSCDGKVKFFFETSTLNDKDIEKSKTLVTVSGIKPEDSRFNIGNKLTINGKLRLPFSAANPSQFDYVSPDTPLSEKVLNAAVGIFVELKTEVFSALGVTEIAKAVGLM